MKRKNIKESVSDDVIEESIGQAGSDEIRFYRSNEKPYGPLSNLYKCSVAFESRIFPTSEHAYQAGKARKDTVREWVLSAPSPSLVAMAAHGLYTWDIAPNWSKTKFDRMRGVLYAKFTQHPELRELLLSTGNSRLVEVATVDNDVNRLWGEVNGKGKNMLGVLLMELREKLRQEDIVDAQVKNLHKNDGVNQPEKLLVAI